MQILAKAVRALAEGLEEIPSQDTEMEAQAARVLGWHTSSCSLKGCESGVGP